MLYGPDNVTSSVKKTLLMYNEQSSRLTIPFKFNFRAWVHVYKGYIMRPYLGNVLSDMEVIYRISRLFLATPAYSDGCFVFIGN